jgi:hypothetical protein
MLAQPRQHMQRNVAPVACPLCGRPVRFEIVPTGKLEIACGRIFPGS